jgi:hypothetical protein
MRGNRQFISHSFSLSEHQLKALENYAAYASQRIQQKITMSELVRYIIEDFLLKNTINGNTTGDDTISGNTTGNDTISGNT